MESDCPSDKDHDDDGQSGGYPVGKVHDIEEVESDSDYRARIMHINTFLRLNESIDNLKKLGKQNPALSTEVKEILKQTSSTVCGCISSNGITETSPKSISVSSKADGDNNLSTSDGAESIKIKTHTHLIYYGDLLQLSKETVYLMISSRDMLLFQRIIHCSERMILGQHTNDDLANMRRDFDVLINLWNDRHCNEAVSVGSQFDEMMRSVMNTPLYFVNSCTALIACGQMLRNLYAKYEVTPLETYQQLVTFVRKHIRHNSNDPFFCDCANSDENCSRECKTLLSIILELPVIAHHQTYLLQVLSYLMYGDQSCREEVFINSLKSTCSPGLLDKIPARLALLMGTFDEKEIRKRFKDFRKRVQHLNPLKNDRYSRSSLDKLVQLVHDPRLRAIIETLPCASAATVEIRLPKCCGNKDKCLNRDEDEEKIMTPNIRTERCCGIITQRSFHLLASSLSLAQLLVYTLIDTKTGPQTVRQHFYVREIITSIARTMKIKTETLEDLFSYLDRMRVFTHFDQHPYLSNALFELVTSYMDSIKESAEHYKTTTKSRRIRRYLKRFGGDDSVV